MNNITHSSVKLVKQKWCIEKTNYTNIVNNSCHIYIYIKYKSYSPIIRNNKIQKYNNMITKKTTKIELQHTVKF